MKNLKQLFFVALGLVCYAATNAQSTATATATATIVTPIAISKTADMNFGNIAVTSSGGNVVLANDGTRTKTGGVTLPATAGTVTAAAFTVTGTSGYAYSVTLPSAAVTLTRASGSETMAATAFTHDATGTLTGGTENIKVGATLAVAAAQVAGSYVSSAFNVTVNYN